jgi:hypothetical protein
MSEIERIVEQLRQVHEGEAWHGPSVREAVAGVTARGAAARPVGAATPSGAGPSHPRHRRGPCALPLSAGDGRGCPARRGRREAAGADSAVARASWMGRTRAVCGDSAARAAVTGEWRLRGRRWGRAGGRRTASPGRCGAICVRADGWRRDARGSVRGASGCVEGGVVECAGSGVACIAAGGALPRPAATRTRAVAVDLRLELRRRGRVGFGVLDKGSMRRGARAGRVGRPGSTSTGRVRRREGGGREEGGERGEWRAPRARASR